MGAPSETYVDPSIAGNSGTGTSGDPYGDLQYALDTMTRDSTNGDRINIKAGTDEILSSALSAGTYGTPTKAAPLIFQGYNSTAGDGGIGGISGNGSVAIWDSTSVNHVTFADLHLHNCGSARIIRFNDNCNIINCELDNTTGGALDGDKFNVVIGSYIHNIGGQGCDINGDGVVAYNFFADGTNRFNTHAVRFLTSAVGVVFANVFDIGDNTNAIQVRGPTFVASNSIYSPSGTGVGLDIGANNSVPVSVINNIVSGFNGVGGVGIDLSRSGTSVIVYGGNAIYNATTEEIAPNNKTNYSYRATDSLGSEPFNAPGSDDFAPNDVGNLKQGAVPPYIGGTADASGPQNQDYRWVGAVEPEEPAGGGGSDAVLVPQGLHPIGAGITA